jgi:hypothetical protein
MIHDLLPPSSYSFLVLELRFKNEADVPALVRSELDGLLPHGIGDNAFFFQRIGRSKRFMVTLIKPPLAEGFRPERVSLPFALTIGEKGPRSIAWDLGGRGFRVEYELGLAIAVVSWARDDQATDRPPADETLPPFPGNPPIQCSPNRGSLLWRIAAASLAVSLAAQVALIAWQTLSLRSSRLAQLEGYLALLQRSGATQNAEKAADAGGYQLIAGELERRVASRWRDGFYLTAWTLKRDRLRLEGWGRGALGLLSSLKLDPSLRGLSLSSMKTQDGFDFFVFEGAIAND